MTSICPLVLKIMLTYLQFACFTFLSLLTENGCQGDFIQTAYRRAKTTITCDYPGNKYKSNAKFFCKEKDFTCKDIFSTKSSKKLSGRFSLTETKSGFSVSISNVSSHDAGVYWCGEDRGNQRAEKIQLKVKGESDIWHLDIFTHIIKMKLKYFPCLSFYRNFLFHKISKYWREFNILV